ncbi:MAG: hypothetical protein ACOYLH_02635 [Flavobacteriales bacterium]
MTKNQAIVMAISVTVGSGIAYIAVPRHADKSNSAPSRPIDTLANDTISKTPIEMPE